MAVIWQLPAQVARCREHFGCVEGQECSCPQMFYQMVRDQARTAAMKFVNKMRNGSFGMRYF